jgi:hypothetical protein
LIETWPGYALVGRASDAGSLTAPGTGIGRNQTAGIARGGEMHTRQMANGAVTLNTDDLT